MSYWLSYIFPRKVAEFHTPWNAYIRINEESGEMKLLVNGSPQSGRYIRGLWKSALTAFDIGRMQNIRKVLVLGIAGGTVIHMIRVLFPDSSITAVDIDPVMIRIGRKYFSLGAVKKLRMLCDDAQQFILKEQAGNKKYDLVVIDLSFGRVIPTFVERTDFLHNVKKIMSKKGILVLNYLRELEYKKKSELLYQQLKKICSRVEDHAVERNRFFFAGIV